MISETKRRPGLQAKLARKTGICPVTICHIFTGKRRATVEQAKVLVPLLQQEGISVTGWDLVSAPKGASLAEIARMSLEHKLA